MRGIVPELLIPWKDGIYFGKKFKHSFDCDQQLYMPEIHFEICFKKRS